MLYQHLLWDDDGYGEHAERDEHIELDLTYPLLAYFYGLALSDGSIRQDGRNSGAVAIELNSRDALALLHLHEVLPWPTRISCRTRTSPFSGAESRTTALVCHSIDLRQQLIARGFPVGQKAAICSPPQGAYDRRAFWRGFVDGDGSLGLTAAGIPFISIVTKSPAIADAWLDYIEPIIGARPSVSRNKRDGVWNIMLMRRRAAAIVADLYRIGDDTGLPRKVEKAEQIMALDWANRPDGRRRSTTTLAGTP